MAMQLQLMNTLGPYLYDTNNRILITKVGDVEVLWSVEEQY